jgi:hypothetical protein
MFQRWKTPGSPWRFRTILPLRLLGEGHTAGIGKEKIMRTLFTLMLAAGAFANTMEAAPAAAEQRCRMEQQCRWVNFKKICRWVRVCRER